MMQPGLTATVTHTVCAADTARALGSGSLEVLGTPRLAAWMEETACACLAGETAEDLTSVGVELRLRHMAATPVGLTVTCEAILIAVDDRRLTFRIRATDGVDIIGEADHERVLVRAGRFMEKAAQKAEKA